MNITDKIGIGTVQFGMKYGISNKTGKTPLDEIVKILECARYRGISLLDTARAYGDSEAVLGSSRIAAEGFRIVSKFMPSKTDGSIIHQFEQTCQNLKAERLYAYLAHRPIALLDNNKEDWKTAQSLKAQNRVQKVGVSINDPMELDRLNAEGINPDIVQVPYNYFDSRFEPHMIRLKQQRCEVHTRSAFLQGLFFANVDKLPPFFDEVKGRIKSLQAKYGEDLPNVLLKYVLKKPFIDKVIVGVENAEQMERNIEGVMEAVDILNADVGNPISVVILNPSSWPKI